MSTKQERKNERSKTARPQVNSRNSFLPPPKELKQRTSPRPETKKSPTNIAFVLPREFVVCNKDGAAIQLFAAGIECRTALVLESKHHIALAHIDSPMVGKMIGDIVKRFKEDKKDKKKPIVATIIGGRDNAASKQHRLSIQQALQPYGIHPKECLSDQNVFKIDGLLFMGAISLLILRTLSNIFDYTPSYGILKTEHALLAVLVTALINHLNTPYGLTVEIDTRREECLSIRPTSSADNSLHQYVRPEQRNTATMAFKLRSFLPGNQGNYREIILNTNRSLTDTEEDLPLTEEDERVEELCGL